MQELMRVLLLLLRENVVDLAVEISRRLDLCAPPKPRQSELVSSPILRVTAGLRRGGWGTHRCREIEHGLACDGCFFVVILDFDVDDVHRSVQLAASVEQVYR